MTITITNINLKLNNGELKGANIYFTGKEESINLSGYIPMTAEEYDGKTYSELEALVSDKIIEKLQSPA